MNKSNSACEIKYKEEKNTMINILNLSILLYRLLDDTIVLKLLFLWIFAFLKIDHL